MCCVKDPTHFLDPFGLEGRIIGNVSSLAFVNYEYIVAINRKAEIALEH